MMTIFLSDNAHVKTYFGFYDSFVHIAIEGGPIRINVNDKV